MKGVLETSLYLIIMAWICVISTQFILMNGKVTKVNEVSTYIENYVEAKGEGDSDAGNYKTYTYKSVVKVGYVNDSNGNTTYTFRDEETKKQFIYDGTNFKVASVNSDGTVGSYSNISVNDSNYKYILDYKDYSKYETWYTATDSNSPYVCVFKKDANGNSRKEEVATNTSVKDFNETKQDVSNFDYTRVFIHYSDNFKAQLDQIVESYKKMGYTISFSYYDTTNDYGYISYSINYKLVHGFFSFSTAHQFNGIARFPISGVVGTY